ncbi:MAG: hypothetical protein IJI66_09780 [Erysipelotrichaceae bacterium]|nr:hypothetical protein [Erysipelotrichaceae bacterium]
MKKSKIVLIALFFLLVITGCSSTKYNFDGEYQLKSIYTADDPDFTMSASELGLSGTLTMKGEDYEFKLVATGKNMSDTVKGKYEVLEEDENTISLSLPELDGFVVFTKSSPPAIHLSGEKYDPLRFIFEKK